jgi:hypothetical protein
MNGIMTATITRHLYMHVVYIHMRMMAWSDPHTLYVVRLEQHVTCLMSESSNVCTSS